MEAKGRDFEMLKRNPFYEDPLHKAYYHPTRQKILTKEQSKTALSSERVKEEMMAEIKKTDDRFLKGSNLYSKKLVSTREAEGNVSNDTSGRFNESWPDSERPSTVDIADYDPRCPSPISTVDPLDQLRQYKARMVTEYEKRQDKDDTGKDNQPTAQSTLSKYIERFRHGTPMSREERQKAAAGAKTEDFWWLQHKQGRRVVSRKHDMPPTPSDSSTPREEDGKSKSRLGQTVDASNTMKAGKKQEKQSALPVFEASCNPWDDNYTQMLQHKADLLLEKSHGSSLNSSDPVVSTDGLGSTTSALSTLDEAPYRPLFARIPTGADGAPMLNLPKSSGGTDDILQQWRLRRKLEQARSNVDPYKEPALPSEVEVEVDKKLHAFKERLKGGVNFTPSPLRHPQNAPTNQDHPPARNLPPKQDFTQQHQVNAPTTSATSASATSASAATSAAGASAAPVVASPHLTPAPDAPVCGHLHLSCDILPCPHHGNQHHHQTTFDLNAKTDLQNHQIKPVNDTQTSEAEMDTPQNDKSEKSEPSLRASQPRKSNQSPPRSQSGKGARNMASMSWRSVDMQSSCDLDLSDRLLPHSAPRDSDASFERMKMRHLNSLKREEGLDYDEVAKLKANQKLAFKKRRQKVDVKDEVPVRDSDVQVASERLEESNAKDLRGKGVEEEIENHAKSKNDLSGSSESESMKSHSKSKKLPQSEKVRDKKGRKEERKEGELNEEIRKVDSGKREVKGKGLVHSSPKASPVQSTIGQVIGERLFLPSTSVLSSIDSLDVSPVRQSHTAVNQQIEADSQQHPSTQHPGQSGTVETQQIEAESQQHQSTQQQPTQTVITQDTQGIEDVVCSDGEDFQDDDILTDLRNRRKLYLSKLRAIDMVLAQSQ